MSDDNSNRRVCIIGGGPGGLSCALWLKYLGLTPIILERTGQLGGLQNASHFTNAWYLGITGHSGQQMAAEFTRHAELENLPVLFNAEIRRIGRSDGIFQIDVNDARISARALVICTGQRIKGFADIQAVAGSAILRDSPKVCFNPGDTPLKLGLVAGQDVTVVGGGDNGIVTAAVLSETANHVHLLARSRLHGFGQYQSRLMDAIRAGKVTLHERTELLGFDTAGDRFEIAYRDANGLAQLNRGDLLFFRLGFSPNVGDVQSLLDASGLGQLEQTATGHIQVDERTQTSIQGIHAVGDVTNGPSPCVATAVAQGTVAARAIEADLRPTIWPRDARQA